MKHIRLLTSDISDKIAAGEVVERPASVVKELVENSVDAEASSIFVDLEDGGHSLIRIIDNGCGISEEDLPLAVKRFATSKINSFEDLYSLSSLGFRGEALPSIASVSRLEITSSVSDDDFARRIVVEGSEIIDLGESAGSKGTCVSVTKLFYNTPARKKFQKTASNEMSHIIRFLSHMAVLRRDIHFRLKNNGKILFSYPQAMKAEDCLRHIWGLSELDKLVFFQAESDAAVAEGILCSPEITRSSRNDMMFSVNGRIVKNTQLAQAAIEGYSPFLAGKRYPLVLVSLKISPEKIDVNVHPAKTEINFAEQQKIFGFIRNAVSSNVKKFMEPEFLSIAHTEEGLIYDAVTGEIFEDSKDVKAIRQNIKNSRSDNNFYSFDSYRKDKPSGKNIRLYNDYILEPIAKISLDKNIAESNNIKNVFSSINEIDSDLQKQKEEDVLFKNSEIQSKKISDNLSETSQNCKLETAFRRENNRSSNNNEFNFDETYEFKPFCQIFNTYIAAELNGEFILIDQHAAHEKIIYENLKAKGDDGSIQMLLFPEILEFSPEKAMVMLKYLPYFQKLGFSISEFGRNAFKVNAMPFFMEKENLVLFFIDIIDSIISETASSDILPLEILRHMIACKSALKAGKKLTTDEMRSLFNALTTLNEPFFCPHGRPVVHKFSKLELEKIFKRSE